MSAPVTTEERHCRACGRTCLHLVREYATECGACGWLSRRYPQQEARDARLRALGYRFPTGRPVTPRQVKQRPAWLAFLVRLLRVVS